MSDTPEEQVVFEEGSVKITNLRAVIGSKTFAMSNITSVSMARKNPASRFRIAFIILCSLWAIFVLVPMIFGSGDDWRCAVAEAVMLGILFLLIRRFKPTFIVQVGSASGEVNALSSPDEAYIRRIVDAVNEAIVRKG